MLVVWGFVSEGIYSVKTVKYDWNIGWNSTSVSYVESIQLINWWPIK